MISCLEKVSREERHDEIVRNTYTINDQYSATHKNALSGDTSNGKGTGHGGHMFWLPNCNGSMGSFNFSNFDTAITSNAGNKDDRNARNIAIARSLYDATNQYKASEISTQNNIMDGQYFIK